MCPLPLKPPSHLLLHLTPLGCHRTQVWAPQVIEQIHTGYISYIWYCICFQAALSIWPTVSFPWEIVKDSKAWCPAVHGITKSQTRLSNWTTTAKARSPTVFTSLLSLSESLHSCPANRFISTIFPDSIYYVLVYHICASLSDLLHIV